MQVKMVVTGLTIDPGNNAPIVILRDEESGRVLPIWIGVIEASAIAFELEKVQLTRPMTHDLLRTAVESLGGTVQQVQINDLRDTTYFASVILTQGKRVITMDARPSDAIALALRVKAPIFCNSNVIDIASARDSIEMAQPSSAQPPVHIAMHASPPESMEEADRGEGGPRPILDVGGISPRELLESLTPEDFGKYKM